MAPEVLSNQGYSEKADVYSFAIVLWELARAHVGKPAVPYARLNAAGPAAQFKIGLGVIEQGLRPDLDVIRAGFLRGGGGGGGSGDRFLDGLLNLIVRAWSADARSRPSFAETMGSLSNLTRI